MKKKTDKIEKWLTDKCIESDFDRYSDWLKVYWKAKKVLNYVPNLVKNTYLCARFPFLKFGGGFFQTTSWYWQIDYGWRKAFGIQLCKDLKEVLKRHGCLRTYEITTVKEKFGALNIYDNGAPSEVHDILAKYEYISRRTCIECGRRAKYITQPWEEPYCEDCIKNVDIQQKPPMEAYKDFDWYGWRR